MICIATLLSIAYFFPLDVESVELQNAEENDLPADFMQLDRAEENYSIETLNFYGTTRLSDEKAEKEEREEVISRNDEVTPFYELPLNSKEKKLISYILTTMADKNIIQLGFHKRSLEKKGKKINQVHPMRFLGYAFSQNHLKSALREIRKSHFKWSGFMDGLSRRLKEEHARNNLLVYAPGLCELLHADLNFVSLYLQRGEWETLVKFLLN